MGTRARVEPSERFVLVVEDDAIQARALARELRVWLRVETVGLARAGLARVRKGAGELAALVVDIGLPDGSGFAVAEAARRRQPDLPILVITGDDSTETNHKAFALHAELLLKPIELAQVNIFAHRTLRGASPGKESAGREVEAHAARYAERHGLSGAERAVLAAAMHGLSRRAMAAQLGRREATVKTLVARLLRKTGDKRLSAVVAKAWAQLGQG